MTSNLASSTDICSADSSECNSNYNDSSVCEICSVCLLNRNTCNCISFYVLDTDSSTVQNVTNDTEFLINDTDLINTTWFKNTGLHIVHLNIHFIYPKLDEIKLIMSDQNNIDLFCICETFLDTTVSDQELVIDGYAVFRKDRNTFGGGLLIYVKDYLSCTHRVDLEHSNLEAIWLEVKFKHSKPLLVCYTYRPPSSKVEWLTHFSNSLDKSYSESKECIILGDFNFDLLKQDHNSNTWISLLDSVDFTQLVCQPTRVTQTTSTLIDHAFTNTPNNISEVTVQRYSISDHYPVYITRKTNGHSKNTSIHKCIQYRSLKFFQ